MSANVNVDIYTWFVNPQTPEQNLFLLIAGNSTISNYAINANAYKIDIFTCAPPPGEKLNFTVTENMTEFHTCQNSKNE